MRSRLFLYLAACLLAATTLRAGPTYWNFNSNMEGWASANNISSTVTSGVANMSITGADPFIYSPNDLGISASDYKYVVISLKNQTSANTAELFWITNSSTVYDGLKRVSIAVTPNDTKQQYYIVDLSGNANWSGIIKQIRLDPTSVSSGTVNVDFVKFVGAYPATASTIPGIIELENFDQGGQGNAYYDTGALNNGSQYRPSDSVDIETTTDTGAGHNVGWVSSGEWMEYLVSVTSSGFYRINLRAASIADGNSIHYELDGNMVGNVVKVNNTGGLQTYSNFSSTAELQGGLHILKIRIDASNGGFNLNKLTITQQADPANTAPFNITNANWVATDALGRTIPDYTQTGATRTAKYVGMFYYIWQGAHGNKVYDITKILSRYPADPLNASNPGWGGPGEFHFWGEPEMGYYNSGDPWVIRRNMTMLANAGVDFVFFDVTNGYTYLNVVDTICRTINELRRQGIAAPSVCFTTNGNSGKTINALYDSFYASKRYRNTWFRWQGKPLILGDKNDATLRPEVRDFFTIKKSWVGSANSISTPDTWPWLAPYPQGWGWSGLQSNKEQISVSVAFHPENPQGKNYSFIAGGQPAVDSNYLKIKTGEGVHVSEQWNRALEVDPQIVMVTQWNEWLAQRNIWNKANGMYAGRPIKNGDTYFIDVLSQEFNRDIEPMKGGYTDSYYYQLIANTRKFKGMKAPEAASAPKTISMDGKFTEWARVTPVYKDPKGDTRQRNFPSYDPTKQLVNTTGRNDIIESRTTIDRLYVYFYIKTAKAITPYTDSNWMMIYINSDRLNSTGWEGFDYVINMGRASATQITVKKRVGTEWSTIGSATYKMVGNQMEIAVPRVLLGYTASRVDYLYQIFDNPSVLDNIEDNFVNGDSAPDRRFNYSYSNTAHFGPHSLVLDQINGQVVCSFKRRINDTSSKIFLQRCSDLERRIWTNIPSSSLVVTPLDGDFELVKYVEPTSPGKVFFRLQVSY